eukprot:TRINITY_DN5511_c0_g2_i1.p1 TRINITY_DN5511_c0_g2~~TRINITY_DN5511_c0_g2_i1.p1  ORF type:complete len:126 (+),score=28.40 TRINITY_DN5511_c0_g2_i1:582-959(+)
MSFVRTGVRSAFDSVERWLVGKDKNKQYEDFADVKGTPKGALYVRYKDGDGRPHQKSKVPTLSDHHDIAEANRRNVVEELQRIIDDMGGGGENEEDEDVYDIKPTEPVSDDAADSQPSKELPDDA